MTLFDADPAASMRARRYRSIVYSLLGIGLAAIALIAIFWNWPSEHRVSNFFVAIEAKDFSKAYGIWNNDAGWQIHPEQYTTYPYQRFLFDWGASNEYGLIKSHKILYGTSNIGNTVLVAVEINGNQSDIITLAISKKSHSISFSPFDLTPYQNIFGWTSWHISDHF